MSQFISNSFDSFIFTLGTHIFCHTRLRFKFIETKNFTLHTSVRVDVNHPRDDLMTNISGEGSVRDVRKKFDLAI